MCCCRNDDSESRRVGAGLFRLVLIAVAVAAALLVGILLPLAFSAHPTPIPIPTPDPTPIDPEGWIAWIESLPDCIRYVEEVYGVETVGGSHEREKVVVWTSAGAGVSVTGTYGYIPIYDAAGLRGLACQGFVENEVITFYRSPPSILFESMAYAKDGKTKAKSSLKLEKKYKPKPDKPGKKKWKASDAIVW